MQEQTPIPNLTDEQAFALWKNPQYQQMPTDIKGQVLARMQSIQYSANKLPWSVYRRTNGVKDE